MSNAYHFYLTFNPYLNQYSEQGFTQAHEFYELMQEFKREDLNKNAYWGKIINKDRDINTDISPFNQIIERVLENSMFRPHSITTVNCLPSYILGCRCIPLLTPGFEDIENSF